MDLLSSSKNQNSSKSLRDDQERSQGREGVTTSSPGSPRRLHNVDKSKSAVDLSHGGQAANQPPRPWKKMQVKMASEASRRAEDDRMRRLQEEQELATQSL